METPCIHICRLNATSSLCIGCGRTLDEIGGWAGYSDEKRRTIMQALPQRLENLSETTRETHTA
ncbi:DUF1289 domain-containing protein [Agrobacterium genomosp. 3]|uniref:Fe-S protein n=1 Tax=Agrobacterium tomkonis CFBP 6623 TaxID=1183432 RepID=A0A1S7NYA6_9HYPH|nr:MULTISPECIES: DUF1289 domain-containing protein [Rhizobium/Agrobacterium group]MCA1868126.1 DUF1289 domain-containing protein [Agrobacterium tomkonis]KNY34805.1 Fe-S protein [Agrobacterium sp. SUL3]KRA63665.1 Fe-S protein [Rhizobium sp. Root651]MCA1878477.1 DUF1289 domain-containing protein [Agrobacterium tumefaciens]MCA1893701.1 DUF1289 domain-containing protein [Agrobacterium tomkonis]